ncbi:MAG: hypothetical protein NTU53_07885 [Planctomycetota bacterium]|nr:hypothetical protein [Planctomycetota bacterium]
MRRITTTCLHILVPVLAIVFSAQAGFAETFGETLYRIDQMRAAHKTPFDQVEQEAATLLRKHPRLEDQALIYYTVAEVYAQSGQVTPAKTVEFCQKALQCPLEPMRKLQLYIYWGDAIQVMNAGVVGSNLAAARRQAVIPYLKGLKETLHLNLPLQTPEIPAVAPMPSPNTPDYQEALRIYQAQISDRELAMRQRDMIRHRDTLSDQIVFMYSRMPFAPQELKSLATASLADPAAVDRLTAATAATVQHRLDAITQKSLNRLPKDLDTPVATSAKSPRASATAAKTAPMAPLPLMIPRLAKPAVHHDQSPASPAPAWDWWTTLILLALLLLAVGVIGSRRHVAARMFALRRLAPGRQPRNV